VTNALGTDAIKVGVLYRPAVVTPVGTTATLNTTTFVNAGDGSPRNRPALAQAFEENATGARFIAVVNHLKSKGSACDAPDTGDGQGNCSAVRAIASQALTAWLATDPTGVGDRDVLLVGDYNAYAKEAAITTIEAAGYTNLIAASNGPSAYSYVFDGQWGYLDHALASSSLAGQVRGVTEWHINADEPSVLDYNTDFKSAGQQSSLYAADQFRTSDHDPVLVDLALTVPYTFGGFAEPLTAPGATDLNAGRALPVTFSLGGVEGEAVVATSLLRWVVTDCTSGAVLSTQPVELAGSGRVGFDGVTGRYSLLIKSDKAWAGRCQTLEIVLTDGTDTMVRRLPLIFRPAS